MKKNIMILSLGRLLSFCLASCDDGGNGKPAPSRVEFCQLVLLKDFSMI